LPTAKPAQLPKLPSQFQEIERLAIAADLLLLRHLIVTGVLVTRAVFELFGIPKSRSHPIEAASLPIVTKRRAACSVMSLALLLIATVLAWCLTRSPGTVLALVAALVAVIWG
jgi:hypothetical protein